MTDEAPPATPPGWYPDPSQVDTQRYWDGSEWTDQRAPINGAATPANGSRTGTSIDIAANLRLALVGLGSLVVIVAAFLPRYEPPSAFTKVVENSLIQNSDGAITIALAVAAIIAAWVTRNSKRRGWLIVALGLAIVAFAVYFGTGDRMLLQSTLSDFGGTSMADPGIGIWATGVGGAIIALAGLRRD